MHWIQTNNLQTSSVVLGVICIVYCKHIVCRKHSVMCVWFINTDVNGLKFIVHNLSSSNRCIFKQSEVTEMVSFLWKEPDQFILNCTMVVVPTFLHKYCVFAV